jgi:O-antigen/teichoic acid export membrane protein
MGLTLVSLIVALAGRDLVALVVPSRLDGAQRVVPIVAFAHVAFAAYVILSQGIWYGMRTRLVPLLTLFAGLVNVALNIALVPHFGILAAAWNTVAGFTVLAALHGAVAARVHRIPWEFGRWAKVLAAAAAAYGVASSAGVDPSAQRAVLEVCAVALVFPVVLLVLRFWTPSERQAIRSAARLRSL